MLCVLYVALNQDTPCVCPDGCLFIFFNFFGGSNNAWQIHKFASINKKLWSVARRNKMAEAQGTDYYTYEDEGRSAFGGVARYRSAHFYLIAH